MGYTAAALNKNGEDASETILAMLRAASPNRNHLIGVADHRDTEINKTPDFTSITGPVLLAKRNIFPERYPPEPLHQENHSLAFNGILLDTEEADSLSAANTLRGDPSRGIETLISERTGAYTVIAVTKDTIIAGLDYIGTVPLYYGENKETKALASNSKTLWAIGIEPTPVKPGQIIKITEIETITQQVKTLEKKQVRQTSVETLHQIMNKTTKEYAVKTPRATVAFSGGIDSTLTAHYLQQNNVRLELIWTGLENQAEENIAREAADYLGLKIHTETYTIEDIEKTLETIITSIEEPDPVKTGIAYPFHWAASKSSRLGYTTMYSGNGADELFAGYMKYLDKYLSGGDPQDDIYRDIANSYLQNFHRDHKTCIDQEIRLLLPFTHPRLVEYGLTIPLDQKLPDNRDEPRKKILRELALQQGIPEKLALRPKKAAQYSSGVNKALVKIAKKHGLSLREYTTEKYLENKKMFSRE
ncbi:MAG: asparagine synthase-related protein [Candidatus Bathyarchaeota archaeon]|nr:asparagine synthase-related protein [Candidatus Bathyarchaeota archaeon]